MGGVPSGPKERVWGRSQTTPSKQPQQHGPPQRQGSWGNGPQGYQHHAGFVKGENAIDNRDSDKTDEELERERRNGRRREEDESFRDVSPNLDVLCVPLLIYPSSERDGTRRASLSV